MTPVMRIAAPPMNNHRGLEYGSPHISMTMEGDISKIDALVQHMNAVVHEAETEKESRDTSGSPEGNHVKTEYASGAEQSNGGFQCPPSPMTPKITAQETPAMVSPVLPQSRQNSAIFWEPNAATSWSNVVSSNPPPSPLGMTTRSSSGSGETLLTSNMSQVPANLQNSRQARSYSFGTETPPRNILKSSSFGTPATSNTYQQSSLGVPPSHPGHSPTKDSILPAQNHQGALTLLSSPMVYPSTPYQDFKPRNPSMGTYSPISFGDSSMHSMTTDQTSPMSSPSLSPHVSPATNPRKHYRDPPAWHLSDSVAEYHSEPSSPHHNHHHHHHHRLHSHLPQSIPEHHRHEPDDPALYGHHRTYVATSPPRHMHPQSVGGHHHHHPAYAPRRSGPKPYAAGPVTSHTPLHHRSSKEILKTLLRKKACLYEPEISFAVSLVTWLVGRRLALSQGYFTRQQLQAGVHYCVAGKIREGHVTRTKVNRCMQVILNSCFHYIIPRPDGSEECGEAFRRTFVRESADEEHLLGTLPPPWKDLNLQCMADEESHPSGLFHDSDEDQLALRFGKPGCKESSAASQAGDSLDSGKRSVLLCFNENIRSASDVIRCHNEFIRDVAHTGHLSLSSEDWQSFFSGCNAHRNRGIPAVSHQPKFFNLADMHDRMDRQGLPRFRTSWCAKRYDHDHSFCAFAHVDVNRGWLRRDPLIYSYKPVMCPNVKPLPNTKDCYVNMCPHGLECGHAHSKEEVLYHPETYKTLPCHTAPRACPLGDICPRAHAEVSSLSHWYGGQGKRHYHDRAPYHRSSHGGPKRRGNGAGGHAAGFDKVPEGPPMLYVDPAPLSEFEKTLALPGLQAMFRDHSSSIFHSMMGNASPCEYAPFGYRNTQNNTTANSLSRTW